MTRKPHLGSLVALLTVLALGGAATVSVAPVPEAGVEDAVSDRSASDPRAARRGLSRPGWATDALVVAQAVPGPVDRWQDVPNSMRGQYTWLGIESAVADVTARDLYWRDQLQWKTLEPARGVYDFTTFEAGLAQAQQRGGRFSFRIMAFCPGCGENLTPDYVPRGPDGAPAWNDDAFLSAWEGLMSELGRRYSTDPRLSMLDFGGYGWWGEWYMPPEATNRITDSNARRLMAAVLRAFPDKFVLINFMDPYPAMAAALSDKVGLRVDCIGGFDMTLAFLPDRLREIWRRSPVVGEWCPWPQTSAATGLRNVHDLHVSTLSSGNFPRPVSSLGPAEQADYRMAYVDSGYRYHVGDPVAERGSDGIWRLKLGWRNDGVAPTYDMWAPAVRLTNSSGQVVWQGRTYVDLRTVTPDAGVVTSVSDALPSGLLGDFAVSVQVDDQAGYLPPMTLPLPGRDGTGAYGLGRLVLPGT